MTNSKFRKGLTILSSLTLMICFLLYRTGKFDKYFTNKNITIQSSPNGGAANSSYIDTSIKKKDSADKLLLSSSKSIILTDQRQTRLDSLKSLFKDSLTEQERLLLYSSKSGIIFKPDETVHIRPDSLGHLHDSIKIKHKP